MDGLKKRIERILSYEKTKKNWRHTYNSIEFRESSNLNKELFGIPLNRAKNCTCIEDFFFLLRGKYNNKSIFKIMDKKFRVKSVVMNHNLSQPLTPHSSDEDCINFLKIDPRFIKFFDLYPKNWEDLIKGVKVSKDEIKEDPKPVKSNKKSVKDEVENLVDEKESTDLETKDSE